MAVSFSYIDGVGNVSVFNGMAHIDLVAIRPGTGEGQKPHAEPVQHLVMPLPQFVRLCAEMAGHLQKMEKNGLITRQQPEGPAATDTAAPAPGAAGNSASSVATPVEEPSRPGWFGRA